jgi:beta-lactamase regulating signal transducer with metallopeptidase domain
MIAALMVYGLSIAALFALLAFVAERAFAALCWPRRWIWAATIFISLWWPATATQMSHGATAPDYTIAGPVAATETRSQRVEDPDRAAAVTTPSAALPARSEGPSLDVILGYGWLVSSLCVFAVYAAGWIRIRKAARQWEKAVVAGVTLSVSDGTGPAVFGFAKPRIVLPRWLLGASSEIQALALAHERAHIQARDPLLSMSALLLVALVPWNIPLLWQLRRLRFAIEVDCDARVMRTGVSAARYGRMLVAVSQSRSSLPLGALALIEPASQLERRVRIMTAGAIRHSCLLGVAAATASIALTAAAAQLPAPEVDIVKLAYSGPSGSSPRQNAGKEMAGYVLFKRIPISGRIDGIDEIRCGQDAECKTTRIVRDVPGAGGSLELFQDARITPKIRAAYWKLDDLDSGLEGPKLDSPALKARLVLTDASGEIVAEKTLEKPLADIDAVFLRADGKPDFLVTVDYSAGTGDSGPVVVIVDGSKPELTFLRFTGATTVPVEYPANLGTKPETLPGFDDRIIGLVPGRGATEILPDTDGGKKITELLCTHSGYDDPKTKQFVYDPLSIHFAYRRIGGEWHRDATAGFEGCDG